MVTLFVVFNIILLMSVVTLVYTLISYPADRKLKKKIARLKKRGDSLLNEMIEIEENGLDIADENRVKKLEEEIQLTTERVKKYIEIYNEKNKLMMMSLYFAIAALIGEIFYFFILK